MLWAALATVYVVWGSTYLAIRVMVETMPPLLSGGSRFLLAGALYLTVLRLRPGGRERIRITSGQVAGTLFVGAFLVLGGNGLVAVAEQDVPSGLAALIVGSIPLFVVILRRLHSEQIPAATLAGVLVGFAGLAVLVLPSDRPGDAPLGAMLILVAAAFCWAIGSFYSRSVSLPDDPFVTTAWQMLLGGLVALIAGVSAGEVGDLDPAGFSTDSIAAFAYLVVIGSMVAFTAYVWLLKSAPISTVATYAFVNPVIAVALGAVILDEEVTATVIAGAVLIVASVATVVRRESAPAPGPIPAKKRRPWSRRASP